ncbi:unnamed protein product [Linum trigynum]|uniref:CCHC-type domain-containing protein n=1 Tax=Linum trigynum TaxID=586398 RepID=A0AAV2FNA3_9ROSI
MVANINSGETVINLDDTNTIVTLNLAAQLPAKLFGDNFLTWRAQLFTLLRGLDLLKFIDCSHPEPVATAVTAVRTQWVRQDQLILHAILASVSPGVAPYVSAAATARQAWTILERMFASQSRQRVINLKGKLLRETQGNRLVSVYLQAMRTTVAELALVNAPVSDEDLILHILRGLHEKFGQLVAAIVARDTTIQIEDLHDRLVDFKADLAVVRISAAPTTYFSSARGDLLARTLIPVLLDSLAAARSRPSPMAMITPIVGRRVPALLGLILATPPVRQHPSLLGRPQLLCQYCDKPGHSAKDCYRIRGRPQAHQQLLWPLLMMVGWWILRPQII